MGAETQVQVRCQGKVYQSPLAGTCPPGRNGIQGDDQRTTIIVSYPKPAWCMSLRGNEHIDARYRFSAQQCFHGQEQGDG